MSVPAGEEIGEETHEGIDQVLVFFITRGAAPLELFTVYTPPEHPSGTVHRTRAEADAAEAASHA
ncbi:MAG TPA: hypothetical protein VF406_15390 [Thermodesulfobacteriota bacterium]